MHWDCSHAHCCRYSTYIQHCKGCFSASRYYCGTSITFGPGRLVSGSSAAIKPPSPNNFPIPQPQRQILISIRAACLADGDGAYATVQRWRCRDAEGLHCAYRWSTDSLLACCILYIVQDCIHDITTYMMDTCEDILYSIYCTASSSHTVKRQKGKHLEPRTAFLRFTMPGPYRPSPSPCTTLGIMLSRSSTWPQSCLNLPAYRSMSWCVLGVLGSPERTKATNHCAGRHHLHGLGDLPR